MSLTLICNRLMIKAIGLLWGTVCCSLCHLLQHSVCSACFYRLTKWFPCMFFFISASCLLGVLGLPVAPRMKKGGLDHCPQCVALNAGDMCFCLGAAIHTFIICLFMCL